MRQSETLTDLFAALSLAQGEIENAMKDSTNPHFKSKYADLSSVRAAIRDPFAKHGLAISQWPRTTDRSVEIETILSHKSGQFISETVSCPLQKMGAQEIGSALTYLRRYSMMAISGVAPDDDDGNCASAHDEPSKNSEKVWSGKSGANARDDELQATRYYVTSSKVKFSKITSIQALREWWEKEKPIMADMFASKEDPLYVDLKTAYAAHGESLKLAELNKVPTTAEQIGDAIPY